ncbi:uncharacterized protein LOC110603959 isoform X2 [Manihot esculenta]|uniref:BZIP domain-containing protein n=1 Tax=Manihot esculenta TaxID=3983 RepID=A0A2C9UBF7_MANES|nr:uncharacterized protein LOC110603959 isoform X2 [Manihot esculenta]OAY27451.1 hypothetical protein MANES_16G126300v8 [Manihot esculenta]
MVKDEWIRAAMTDDRVVVELLVRLKQEAAQVKPQAVIPLRWGLRLPRSKPATAASMRYEVVCRRKEGDSSARCSPTTPLSWSGGGGASPSATADGFEETSPHVICSTPGARSKVTATGETASTTTKKSRRKKTFAELKEEESVLLKERMHLKKELATINATFKEQIERNENLKRLKIDLSLQFAKTSSSLSDLLDKAICNQPCKREPSSPNHISSMSNMHAQDDDNTESDSCERQETVSNHDRSFLLPDLNMMPSEDPHSETLPVLR